MLPTFACIIPTHNRAPILKNTLESVYRQARPPDEVIVVDDASTDDTPRILEKFSNRKGFRALSNKTNQERAYSRNLGAKTATSDFVTFLDSDDLLYWSFFEDAEQFIKGNPGSRFFHSLYEFVDTTGAFLRKRTFPAASDFRRGLATGNYLSCIGVFVWRRAFLDCLFDESPEVIGSEDWDLWLRLGARHDLARIDKVNCAMSLHQGRSMNRQTVVDARQRAHYVLKKVASDPQLSAVYGRLLPRMAAGRAIYVAGVANDSGQSQLAREELLRAARLHPRMILSWGFLRNLQRSLV